MEKRIDEMFAFVAVDPADDTEGIMGFLAPGMDGWMPMVGADMDRVKSLLPMADIEKKKTGIDFRILKFSKREDITDQAKGK